VPETGELVKVGDTAVFTAADLLAGNGAVARNVDTGKAYDDVSDALDEVKEGETVQLLKDIEAGMVIVPEGVELDLNGCELTASYVSSFGDIVDNSDDTAGRLVVPAKRIMLNESNKQLPIKDKDGAYAFVEVKGFNKAVLDVDGYPKYAFQPLLEEAAHELLEVGTETCGITLKVNVSWKQDDGVRTQTFEYNDTFIQQVMDSYDPTTGKYSKMFTLTLKSDVENLIFDAIVESDTKVFSAASTF